MEKACRIIIEDILKGKISTRRELEVEKRQLCRDLKLSRFMSNADILEYAKPEEKTYQNHVRRCYRCRYVPPTQMPTWALLLLSGKRYCASKLHW